MKLRLIILSFILSLSGCSAYYGGGTTGTGLGLHYGGGTTSTGAIQHLFIKGVLLSPSGKKLKGRQVVVETSSAKDKLSTDAAGRFTAEIVRNQDEPIVFTFSSGKQSGSFTLYELPELKPRKSGSEISLIFVVDSKGKIKLNQRKNKQ